MKIIPNSVPSSVHTVQPCSALKKILTTKHRNQGREGLTELLISLAVQGSRKDALQTQLGKHHLHKQPLFIEQHNKQTRIFS